MMHIRQRDFLTRRRAHDDPLQLMAVAEIVRSVREQGDAAVRAHTARFDGVDLKALAVPDLGAGRSQVSAETLAAMRLAAHRLEHFHRAQPVASWTTGALGGTVGQRVDPLERVGLYVPGGSAPLISTVLHTAIPARVAGVGEIVIATPPSPAFAASDFVHPAILAAAELVGAQAVLRIGGAQAIAALAYGTETIEPVDKICGPGNIWVTLAKKLVYGVVGLDGLAGPTETIVIADDSADPAWVAADLLAQAEHDTLAAALLLTPSTQLASAVQVAIAAQLETLPRAAIVVETFNRNSGIVLVPDLDDACALANAYAPEHLCLAVRDPNSLAPKLTRAGGLFLGEHSFEVLGDYVAGPSHVMPTGGTARFASPLNVLDFIRLTSIVALDPATTRAIAPHAAALARAESLEGHARSALSRVAR
jgi:histidinol dehydrogenase